MSAITIVKVTEELQAIHKTRMRLNSLSVCMGAHKVRFLHSRIDFEGKTFPYKS